MYWVMPVEQVRYKYRVYPTPAQDSELNKVFGCVRVVFNDHLFQNGGRVFGPKKQYRNALTMSKVLITDAKRQEDRAWLSDAPTHALQQSIRDSHQAFDNFFKSAQGLRAGRRVGFPNYKRKSDHRNSFSLSRTDFTLVKTGKKTASLRLPKGLGTFKVVYHRNLPAAPSSLTIVRNPDGTTYVSFVVKRGTRPLPFVPTVEAGGTIHPAGRVAAVDLGLIDLAAIVYSDGTREKIAAPKHYRRIQRKLATAQKELARRKAGSKNREKSRITVAALHARVAAVRADGHHKLASRLARENQTVIFETLSITGLARTNMAKSIHDAAWGQLIRYTKEKTVRYGRTFTQTDRFLASTQICAVCTVRDGPKDLDVRVWDCPTCKARLDRDYNAATNVMVASGTVETLNACGDGVRLRQLLATAETASNP